MVEWDPLLPLDPDERQALMEQALHRLGLGAPHTVLPGWLRPGAPDTTYGDTGDHVWAVTVRPDPRYL